MGKFKRTILGGALFLALALFTHSSSAQTQGQPQLSATRIAGGFTAPVFITAAPDDTSRIFIVQQNGQIRIVNLADNTINPTPFLDISSEVNFSGEEGLLGFTFAPDYSTSGHFYVDYVASGGSFGQGVSHVAEFTVSSDPNVANQASERTLLTFDQPQTNHNGGWIGFSPRARDTGNLYIATGDGGNGNDQGTGHIEPGGNAQSTQTLLGKILRIHVKAAPGTYSIPPNNPFAGSTSDRQEIWLFGLRNPFRNSFDRMTGKMFIGDVGQDTREEIDTQSPNRPGGGQNYGWRVREGTVQNPAYPSATPPPNAREPFYDYPHSVGQTVIGGYFYRGADVAQLRNRYVFADYLGPEGGSNHGRIFTLRGKTTVSAFRDITAKLFPTRVGNFPLLNPVSLGEDARGELYIADIGSGNIFKITGAGTP